MKRTKEDAELTKKKLLDTAFKEFLEIGFENFKLQVITAKAGVTRGAFYWHYKDKEDLLRAIIEHKDLESIEIASEIFNSDLEPFEKLKNLVSLNFPELPNKAKEKKYARMKVELYNYLNKNGDKRNIAGFFIQMSKDLLDE
ncbi:MAG: TetR/AcrR family transcriptional regulator, partial [Ignavibacteria bacterium]